MVVGGGLVASLGTGGAFDGGGVGSAIVSIAVLELGHDGLECLVKAGLDSGGVGEEVQLDHAVVGDFDGVHRRGGCGDDVVQGDLRGLI